MKTLLLTSQRMGVITKRDFEKLTGKPAREITVAYIPTAADVENDKNYMDLTRRDLTNLGLTVFDIDLTKDKNEKLKNKLGKADIIYVEGGNTFYLLKYIRQSGFADMIRELLEEGKIYIGVSAGSYVCCPTIDMATWKNLDKNTVGLIDLRGMNLVPFLLFVHYQKKWEELVKEKAKTIKYPLIVLTDKQSILVQDNHYTFLGKGKPLTFNI
ncbi:Type 1 glutamine amidotransferase-like domain-containing protein [Candidatus Microgenomates bacterium]|nr:Type 1 glutamine amidotransferase-like domain-containing protein [Candidatus Microgenomates bacterium]